MSQLSIETKPGKRGHIVADTNVSPFARARTQILCPGHKKCFWFCSETFVSATNVSQFAQPKKHHGQQCVRNNVSSFTRALMITQSAKNCAIIAPSRARDLIHYLWTSLFIDRSECLHYYLFRIQLPLFCTVLRKNCTVLSQSESSNFFMYIIK